MSDTSKNRTVQGPLLSVRKLSIFDASDTRSSYMQCTSRAPATLWQIDSSTPSMPATSGNSANPLSNLSFVGGACHFGTSSQRPQTTNFPSSAPEGAWTRTHRVMPFSFPGLQISSTPSNPFHFSPRFYAKCAGTAQWLSSWLPPGLANTGTPIFSNSSLAPHSSSHPPRSPDAGCHHHISPDSISILVLLDYLLHLH